MYLNWCFRMRLLMTNGNYITIMCILGGSLGFFNALMTQVEPDSETS